MSETPDFQVPNRNQPDGSRVRFYIEAVKNNVKSEREGRPVFDNVEMAHILVPGDRLTEVHRIVTDEVRRRWPEHYTMFKQGLEAPVTGTPLSEWGGISKGHIEELRYSKVYTVEELAGLSDAQLTKSVSMGGIPLRDAAKRFLANLEGAAPMEKLAAENVQKDARISELEATVRDLNDKFNAMIAQRQNDTSQA
jgi:hypothetical protein